MKPTLFTLSLILLVTSVFSQETKLDPQSRTIQTVHLKFPVNSIDVRAVGMGHTQIANGKHFNAMMYNPALLSYQRNSVEIFGIQAGLPPATYDAADYLSHHIAEFEEALSLNQIMDGLEQLTEKNATNAQKLDALNQIQDGLVFVDDLFREVTGPGDDPKVHGINIIPGINAQIGNWGFSLYGFGQAGFMVQLSPTFEALLDVEVPTTLSDPRATLRAAIELTEALVPAMTGPRKFSDQAFPTAFYVSYFDVIGAVGYGRQVYKNLSLGANLKIINRRFLIDKINAEDYDQIISDVWDKFQSNVTGVTADVGAHYQFRFGSSVGVSMQNIFPVKEITKSVDTEFRFNQITRSHVNRDSLEYDSWETTITRPFTLEVPFILSIGVCHPITANWDVAFDWVDLAENDTRYEESADRIRLGTEYRYPLIKDKLTIASRLGMSDQRITVGMGLKVSNYLHIDSAYAYDRFVNENAFFAQIRIGW